MLAARERKDSERSEAKGAVSRPPCNLDVPWSACRDSPSGPCWKCRALLDAARSRRFWATGWWSKGDSNREPLSDAFMNFSQFEGRGDAIGDGPERVESGYGAVVLGRACLFPPLSSVPSRFVLEFADASSGDMRLSDHAARSMILSDGFSARVCHPSTLRM